MSIIDTHAHLTHDGFRDDLAEVLQRARSSNVSAIVCVSESLADANNVISLCNANSSVLHPAVGMHPERAVLLPDALLNSELEEMTQIITTNNTVSILGEIGLDYTPRVLATAPSIDEGKKRQRKAFSHFIHLSETSQLPMTIHSRGAGHHTLAMITDAAQVASRAIRATFHAYDGRAVYAERALDRMKEGLYFSVPPCIVRSDNMIKTVRRLPLERLVLESDSPALAAVPLERNEPSQIIRSLQMIAAIKGISEERTQQVIFENTLRAFPTLRGVVFERGNGYLGDRNKRSVIQ